MGGAAVLAGEDLQREINGGRKGGGGKALSEGRKDDAVGGAPLGGAAVLAGEDLPRRKKGGRRAETGGRRP